ncbi:MAG: hypothetical protein WB661_12720 [Candidatus Bathyarchaeia archaeon]
MACTKLDASQGQQSQVALELVAWRRVIMLVLGPKAFQAVERAVLEDMSSGS